jgi:putative acetyltransferase
MIRTMEPADIQLRRARPDDAESFAAMMNDPAVFPGVLQMPHTDAAFWRERLKDPGGPSTSELHLVALHEGLVVGSAGLHPVGPAVRRRHAVGLGITVAGPWQGRGVGTRLMAALCEHADRWLGVLRIELTVYADNTAAMALYRKFGFELEGTHRAYALRDGCLVDAHCMARLHPQPPGLKPRV